MSERPRVPYKVGGTCDVDPLVDIDAWWTMTHGGRPPVVDAGRERRTLDPDLAARLDQARRRVGLTIRDVELLTGISKSMISYVVRGERVPCRAFAELISKTLRLDSETRDWLLDSAVERAWPK